MRLKGYNYSSDGAYFVTICARNRECLFGDVMDGEIRLNDAGHMVERWWNELGRKFPNVVTDVLVVMPNHIHGIIVIVGADLRVRPDRTDTDNEGAHIGAPLPKMVQWFKTMTTNEYIIGVKQHERTPFHGKLWQRNYYERVIRNDVELNRVRQYICDNPLNWETDDENPKKG